MGAAQQVEDLLRESGAVLLRDRKHLVYRLPNGQKFTRSKTPSDRRAAHNDLSDLRRALGLENTGAVEGGRREKRRRQRVTSGPLTLKRTPALAGSLAEQLIASGFAEMAEAAKARGWSGRWKTLARFYRLLAIKGAAEIVRAEARGCPCWWCRLKARCVRGAAAPPSLRRP